MTLKNNFVISEGIFARRLAHGPLNDQESRYRAFLCCEFHELLDVDPWLATAWPTARGRRILVPLIRRVLRHQEELPASMIDWVRLYRQLVKHILSYFESWDDECQIWQDATGRTQLRVVGQ